MSIQSDYYLIYKQSFYNDKQKGIDEFIDKYHIPLIDDIDHPVLIKERKQNIDAGAYENFKPRCKATIKEEENWLSWYHWLLDNKNNGGSQLFNFLGYHRVYWRQYREWENNLTKMVKYVSNVSDYFMV